jgi:dihydroorotase
LKELHIKKVNDMHVHLRQDDMLANVLPHTVHQCANALVMPNTLPPILTADDLKNYRSSILNLLNGTENFMPLMTFKVTPTTTVEEVSRLKAQGAVAGKLYPDGVTTNSQGGVTDFKALYPVYGAMQNEGLVLCLHGEMPGVFSLDRETSFLVVLKNIAADFPKLKIVLEHATTADAINCVLKLPENVAATLTVHHLYFTLDDVIGDRLNPHAFCKPIAKRPEDRDALVAAALSGNPKFFLGSDSAPHSIAAKECACGAAGVYTAPVLLPALCDLFERHDKLGYLERFTSEFAAKFYNLPIHSTTVKLIRDAWIVPSEYHGVKPFWAGQTLNWQFA